MNNMPPEEVAQQFATAYYNGFQSDRQQFLQQFYRANSTLTFESNTMQGLEPIAAKWMEEFLKTAKFQVSTSNAQKIADNTYFILVTGLIQLSENDAPMNYAQTWLLTQDAEGRPYCMNDIFKLVYG
ncbi:nuclear transport factor 2 domain-containing protein [Xylariaceae sp. FL0804]|nr:nuclear transport factor 2 domain-containing protein [Xylariaceae sp. FL0804]